MNANDIKQLVGKLESMEKRLDQAASEQENLKQKVSTAQSVKSNDDFVMQQSITDTIGRLEEKLDRVAKGQKDIDSAIDNGNITHAFTRESTEVALKTLLDKAKIKTIAFAKDDETNEQEVVDDFLAGLEEETSIAIHEDIIGFISNFWVPSLAEVKLVYGNDKVVLNTCSGLEEFIDWMGDAYNDIDDTIERKAPPALRVAELFIDEYINKNASDTDPRIKTPIETPIMVQNDTGIVVIDKGDEGFQKIDNSLTDFLGKIAISK